jgi:hypothetical protein
MLYPPDVVMRPILFSSTEERVRARRDDDAAIRKRRSVRKSKREMVEAAQKFDEDRMRCVN